MGVSATQATGNTGMRLPGICRKEATSSSDQAQHHHFLQLFAPPPPLQLCPFLASAADVICQSSGFTLYHIASYSLGCPLTAIVLLGTSPALSLTVRQHTRSCKAPVLVIMGSAGGPRRGGAAVGSWFVHAFCPLLGRAHLLHDGPVPGKSVYPIFSQAQILITLTQIAHVKVISQADP